MIHHADERGDRKVLGEAKEIAISALANVAQQPKEAPKLGEDLEKVARRICAQFQLVGDWPWEYVYTELKDAIRAAKGG